MENNRGQIVIGGLIMIAITVIVGAIILQASAQNIGTMTDKITVTENISVIPARTSNTSLNVSIPLSVTNKYASTDWRYTDCPMSGFTASVNNGDPLTVTTDYVFTNTGTFVLKDTTATDAIVADAGTNKTLVTYTYCPSTYSNDSGSRAVAGLIIIMIALAIAVVAMSPVLQNKLGMD
jgi:predicted Kef-type K+ transport protein